MKDTILCKKLESNCETINTLINENASIFHDLGQAQLIALLLHSIQVESFNIDDITEVLYTIMEECEEIKDFVYEYMKSM